MKKLPQKFLDSLQGIEGFDVTAFEQVHEKKEAITSIRVNPLKTASLSFPVGEKIPWTQYGYYLPKRPSFTFDPLFHAGCYYVQEASSMFIEQALLQLADVTQPLKVLDVSAAPGGKTTHIQSLLSHDSLLVSNEVIRARCNVLIDNVVKWGAANVIVSNNDPVAFQKLKDYFDILLVDAPCSGSGLFRRDEKVIDEWSLHNVQLCSQRQKRILADIIPSLKEDGLLIYSTCSYSREEDEEIADWLVTEMEMENEHLELQPGWNIVTSTSQITHSIGYRFYPDKVKGEGFFLSCFRKKATTNAVTIKHIKPTTLPEKDKSIISEMMILHEMELVKEKDEIIALPKSMVQDYYFLKNILNIQYAGIKAGEIMHGKLIPHHALALSTLLSPGVPDTSLTYDDAIKYLQRQELIIENITQGRQTVSYKQYRLGWINALKNRINNGYPKEMRILKQQNDNAFEN